MQAISSILVWKFSEAPDKYRDLGEEDRKYSWLAVVPPSMQEEDIPAWMRHFSDFGIEEHWLRSGARVILG